MLHHVVKLPMKSVLPAVILDADLLETPAGVRALISAQEQEEWQLERRRFFSEATMVKIPKPEEPLELTDGEPSAQPAASTSRIPPIPRSV